MTPLTSHLKEFGDNLCPETHCLLMLSYVSLVQTSMLGLYKWIGNLLALSLYCILKCFIYLLFITTLIFKNYKIFIIITKAHLICWFEWVARRAWEYLLVAILLCIEIHVKHPHSWASKHSQAIKIKTEQKFFLKVTWSHYLENVLTLDI